MYLGAPFTFAALQRWPKYRLLYAPCGLAIIAVALIISSFSTRVWQLIATVSVDICCLSLFGRHVGLQARCHDPLRFSSTSRLWWPSWQPQLKSWYVEITARRCIRIRRYPSIYTDDYIPWWVVCKKKRLCLWDHVGKKSSFLQHTPPCGLTTLRWLYLGRYGCRRNMCSVGHELWDDMPLVLAKLIRCQGVSINTVIGSCCAHGRLPSSYSYRPPWFTSNRGSHYRCPPIPAKLTWNSSAFPLFGPYKLETSLKVSVSLSQISGCPRTLDPSAYPRWMAHSPLCSSTLRLSLDRYSWEVWSIDFT